MASRDFNAPKVIGQEVVIIAGSFEPNGSSAITATTRTGRGWSVAYTTTGVYTVTLTDTYNALISATVGLQRTTMTDQTAEIGAVDLAAKTIILHAWDTSSAALADIAAASTTKIHFMFVLSNSATLPVRGA